MKMLKRTFAALLSVMLVVTGMYFAPTEAEEVQAAAVALETGVALKYAADDTTEVTYDVETENPMPVPVDTAYQDYLFAGWFKDEACTLGNAVTPAEMAEAGVESGYYAKFVPRDTLNVKFQTTRKAVIDSDKDGNLITADSAIRFISSVDTLNYSAIGFNVNGEDLELEPYVMEKINSTMKENTGTDDEFVTYEFSPKIVGKNSEYFFTGKYGVEANDTTNYTVKAYYVTLDGTQVYGDARVVGLQDGDANVLNLVVDGTVSGTTATVTNYTSATGTEYTSAATATVISKESEPTTVRVVLDNDLTVDGLTSAAKVTIGEATGIYRNYNTTHEVEGETTINSDTSWYYVDPDAENFVVATSADLYGLAKLVDGATEVFTGKTILLVKDVEINKGKATSDSWEPDADEIAYPWEPIGSGTSGYQFDGTFDGDGNAISGVYMDRTGDYNGLFAAGYLESYFKNMVITNSYFKTNHNYLGSIVGFTYGKGIENCYSDAILVNTGEYQTENATKGTGTFGSMCIGGLIGRWSTNSGTASNAINQIERPIINCWFDGEIYAQNRSSYVGGIIGQVFRGVFYNVENILVTGTIHYAGTGRYTYTTSSNQKTYSDESFYVGGIWAGNSPDATIKMKNCVDAGKIYVGVLTTYDGIEVSAETIGSFMGWFKSTQKATSVEKCYSLKQIFKNDVLDASAKTIATYDGGTIEPTIDTETNLAVSSEAEINVLFGENTSDYWMCHANERGTKAYGTPMLKQFADLWLEERYTMEADTSWFDAENPESEYTLYDEEEFLGLSTLVGDGNTFEGITIKLGDDMKMNKVNDDILASWKDGNEEPNNSWIPIGSESGGTAFNGIFDGQGHSISGIYLNMTSTYVGLFGNVASPDAEIKNVRLIDSLIKNNYTKASYSGTIVGYAKGTLTNVYSDATLQTAGYNDGGMVGYGAATFTMINCWYNGTIDMDYVGTSSFNTGGIMGRPGNGGAILKACLFTGTIDINYKNSTANSTSAEVIKTVGGLVGYDNGKNLRIYDSIAAGQVNILWRYNGETAAERKFTCINQVVGAVNYAGTVADDVYYGSTYSLEVEYADSEIRDMNTDVGVYTLYKITALTGTFEASEITSETTYDGLTFQTSGDATEEPTWYQPASGVPVPYALRTMLAK